MSKSTSELYSESWDDLTSNPILLVPIILTNVIYFVMMFAVGASVAATSLLEDIANQNVAAQSRAMGMLIVVSIIGALVDFAGYCLLQCMAVEVITEGGTSLGGSLRLMGSRIVPFMGTAVIAGVIIALVAVGGIFIAAALGLPGVILYLVLLLATSLFLTLALPAVVYSELGPLEAIADSFSRVKANFMRVLGFALMTLVIAIGVGIVSTIVAAFFAVVGGIITLAFAVGFSTLVLVALTRLYGDIVWEETRRYEAMKERLSVHSHGGRVPADPFY